VTDRVQTLKKALLEVKTFGITS